MTLAKIYRALLLAGFHLLGLGIVVVIKAEQMKDAVHDEKRQFVIE